MIRLPPLRLLVTFEAVARLGAMREAAGELNVTQPAITQALKALEDHVGVALLDRSRRPARLTGPGHQLARAARDGLETIARAIEEIRADAETDGQRLTVSCTLGMATYWLMPRLPGFYAGHPDVLVNVQAPSTDLPRITAGVDLALRYGTGGWIDGETAKLFDEIICPVGRPAVVERLLADGAGPGQAPLIHVRGPDRDHWTGWEEYLRHAGFGRSKGAGQSFDNYVQAVQATLDGRGLMLGWRSITGALVADGSLIAWPGGAIDLGSGYHATLSPAGAGKASARAFRDWLREQAP
ncbi:MAG: LysR family glycine cleavage system transcriptional activator [Paracoccaceae bacterium]|jgi:DNA-binding transcriptional LysR family regulator